jgi:hypothetical protein
MIFVFTSGLNFVLSYLKKFKYFRRKALFRIISLSVNQRANELHQSDICISTWIILFFMNNVEWGCLLSNLLCIICDGLLASKYLMSEICELYSSQHYSHSFWTFSSKYPRSTKYVGKRKGLHTLKNGNRYSFSLSIFVSLTMSILIEK